MDTEHTVVNSEAPNSFEKWKSFVLGQTKNNDTLPFSYKDPQHKQASAAVSGSRNGWLHFPTWAGEQFGFGGEQSWWETLGLTRTQRYFSFGICILVALLLFSISLMYLPFVMIRPSKFIIPYSMASAIVFVSFGFLQGFITYGNHLTSKDRYPYTLVFVGSTIMTLYSALYIQRYLVTVVCILAQMACFAFYIISYVPGGQTGISYLTSTVGTSIKSRIVS